ncbi:MAG TPA: TIGR01777 family oxidoreductase [Cyclobacteriaceae bacterium]
MPKQILITGASGLVGSRLTQLLIEQGHHVSHLSRSEKKGLIPTFIWDVEKKYIDSNAFNNIDTIIHLAGSGVADKRWNEKNKKEIEESRTRSTKLLCDKLKEHQHQVKTFICASAIGYYGFTLSSEPFTEESKPGNDFLAEVVKAWEAEADQISLLGTRVAKIRIGIVLSKNDGALKQMALPIKLLVGSPLASGMQYMSWVHIDDLCGIFIKSVNDTRIIGAYNGVAPHPVTNKEMTTNIARILKRPLWAPNVPAFVLKLVVGEMADIVINGSNVSSSKIESAEYQFRFPNLNEALNDVLN